MLSLLWQLWQLCTPLPSPWHPVTVALWGFTGWWTIALGGIALKEEGVGVDALGRKVLAFAVAAQDAPAG